MVDGTMLHGTYPDTLHIITTPSSIHVCLIRSSRPDLHGSSACTGTSLDLPKHSLTFLRALCACRTTTLPFVPGKPLPFLATRISSSRAMPARSVLKAASSLSLAVCITTVLSGCISLRTPAAPGSLLTSSSGPTPSSGALPARWPTTITQFPPGFLPETKVLAEGNGTFSYQVVTNVITRGAGVFTWDEVVVTLPDPPATTDTLATTPSSGSAPAPPPAQLRSFTYYAFTDQSAIDNALSLRTPAADAAAQGDHFRRKLDLATASQFTLQFVLWPTTRTDLHRGLIIYQWGLDGYKFESPLVEALRADGWTLLTHNGFRWRPTSGTIIPGGVPGTSKPTPPTPQQAAVLASAAGAYAAAELDSIVGQYVLGHEAALGLMYEQYPNLAPLPLVVMGSSLGSLTTPALVTRLQEANTPVAACVMIGGGGNLLKIVGTSWEDYYYSRVRNRQGMSVPAKARSDMRAEYLRCATLDPLARAAELRRQPLLMIHAVFDLIVPASTGDALWEAAGRPERWNVYAGHIPMFMTLRTRTERIVTWVRNTATPTVTP
jgi:hypothetical protein